MPVTSPVRPEAYNRGHVGRPARWLASARRSACSSAARRWRSCPVGAASPRWSPIARASKPSSRGRTHVRRPSAPSRSHETQLREAFAALSHDALRENRQDFLQNADALLEPVRDTLDKVQVAARRRRQGPRGLVPRGGRAADRRSPARRSSCATPPRACRARCDRRTSAASGAKSSSGASSSWPAWSSTATSSRSRHRPQTTGARLTPDLVVSCRATRRSSSTRRCRSTPTWRRRRRRPTPNAQDRLAAHVRQVRDHIRALGAKEYWKQFQPSPEFVVMFLPLEPLLAAAFEQDATLLDQAASLRVIPATPMTLLALLKAVALRLAAGTARAKRRRDSADRPRALRPPRPRMVGHLEEVGKNIKQAGDATTGSSARSNTGAAGRAAIPGTRRAARPKEVIARAAAAVIATVRPDRDPPRTTEQRGRRLARDVDDASRRGRRALMLACDGRSQSIRTVTVTCARISISPRRDRRLRRRAARRRASPSSASAAGRRRLILDAQNRAEGRARAGGDRPRAGHRVLDGQSQRLALDRRRDPSGRIAGRTSSVAPDRAGGVDHGAELLRGRRRALRSGSGRCSRARAPRPFTYSMSGCERVARRANRVGGQAEPSRARSGRPSSPRRRVRCASAGAARARLRGDADPRLIGRALDHGFAVRDDDRRRRLAARVREPARNAGSERHSDEHDHDPGRLCA